MAEDGQGFLQHLGTIHGIWPNPEFVSLFPDASGLDSLDLLIGCTRLLVVGNLLFHGENSSDSRALNRKRTQSGVSSCFSTAGRQPEARMPKAASETLPQPLRRVLGLGV